MDFSDRDKFEDPDGAISRRSRGCFGSLLRFFLICTALIVGGVALVAWFFTTDLGGLWLLNRINRSIAPSHLRITECKTALLSCVELYGVEFDSPDQGMNLKCRKIEFSRGILGLLPLGKLNLGTIILKSPVLSYNRVAALKRSSHGPAGSVDDTDTFLPFLDFGGEIYVEDGKIVVNQEGKQQFLSDKVEGKLLIKSFWKPFGFKVAGRVGEGTATMTGDLQSIYNLMSGFAAEYDDKVVLQLDRVEVAACSPLIKMIGSRDLLHAGIAEGALTFERAGAAGFKVEGGMIVDGLQIVTGDSEYSPAGNTALMVDARVEDDLWVFKRFDLSSPWLNAKINGSFQKMRDNRLADGDIKVEVDADLAAIATDFRYALDIDDALKVEKGRLHGSLNLSGNSENIRIESDLTCSQIAMRYQGHSIFLKRNPSLIFKAVLPAEKLPELEELKFSSSFADIYGKGTIERGVLKGYLDLTQFSDDFRGVLSRDADFAGAMHFDFSTKPSADDIAFNLMTRFSKFKVSLKNGGKTSIDSGLLKFDGKASGIDAAANLSKLTLRDLNFDLRIDDSNISGALDRYVPSQEHGGLPVVRACKMSCDLKLAEAVTALGAFMTAADYKESNSWSGDVLANLAVEAANGVVKARVNGVGREIAFTVAGKKIKEPDLRFATAITYDDNRESLTISEGSFNAEMAQVAVSEWIVYLADHGQDIRFNGSADANVDLAVLYPLLVPQTESQYDQVRGELRLKLDAGSVASGTELNLNGGVTDFYLLADDQITFFERNCELVSDLLIAKDGDNIKVRSLEISSGLADISAKGQLGDILAGEMNVELHGDMDFKFKTLTQLLNVRGIDEWRMIGHKKQHFHLNGPLAAGINGFLRKGEFEGGVYLESLTGLGLSTQGGEISFVLAQGRMQTSWQPLLNSGQLDFQPCFDFGPRAVEMSFPAEIQVLKGVKITQKMVDNLLVNLSPVFQDSQIHNGTVDLKVRSFRSGGSQNKSDLFLDADIGFNDLSMSLSPSMCEVLAMINVKSTSYRVKQLPMHVVIRDERVYIDLVTMVFSGHPLSFSGSIGFDSSVKYLIEIPVTGFIAAKTGVKIPKGVTIKVPVTGTIDNPRVDTSGLESVVADFIKKAISEDAMRNVGDFFKKLTDELKK